MLTYLSGERQRKHESRESSSLLCKSCLKVIWGSRKLPLWLAFVLGRAGGSVSGQVAHFCSRLCPHTAQFLSKNLAHSQEFRNYSYMARCIALDKDPCRARATCHLCHSGTSPVIRIYPDPPFPPPIPQVDSQCLLVCMAHMRSACHPEHWHWCPSRSPQGRVLPGSCRLSRPIPPPAPLCPFVAHQSHGRSCGWVVALLSHACLQ